MQPFRELRVFIALIVAFAILSTPAQALVTLNFNEGHDHVYVTATVGVSRDSNVFANSSAQGDYIYSTGLTAEYIRRAGWIGVNASASVNGSHFGTLKGEDFSNPSFTAELTKQSGRTTGSLTLGATRSSRADAATNTRSTIWNYDAALNFAYPIIERFKMTGSLGYAASDYVGQTNLVNSTSYTAAVNLFYVYSTERDLSTGYRYRRTSTSNGDATVDHNFSVGMSGRLIRGLNGSVNVGYQFRVPTGKGLQASSSGLSASGATRYDVNRKISLSGRISKDFSTTGTDASVDTLATDLEAKYAYSSHWSVVGGAGWGESRFLGNPGRVVLEVGPPLVLGKSRQDDFFHYDASLNYSRNEHFKLSLSYSWFRNWSTLAYADFVRSGWNLNLNSRL